MTTIIKTTNPKELIKPFQKSSLLGYCPQRVRFRNSWMTSSTQYWQQMKPSHHQSSGSSTCSMTLLRNTPYSILKLSTHGNPTGGLPACVLVLMKRNYRSKLSDISGNICVHNRNTTAEGFECINKRSPREVRGTARLLADEIWCDAALLKCRRECVCKELRRDQFLGSKFSANKKGDKMQYGSFSIKKK